MDADVLQEVVVEFRKLDDAVRQGLIKAADATGDTDIEYGGVVFQDPKTGRFYNGVNGLTKGIKDHVEIVGRKRAREDRAVAGFHSHPMTDKMGQFSGDDTSGARAMGFPMYMVQASNRDGHIFDPAREPSRTRGSVKSGGPSRGRPFMPGEKMLRELQQEAVVAELRK